MAKVTMAVGVALMLLGVAFYVLAGESSVTALIPTFFGIPIFVAGLVAKNESRRKHAMHAGVLFGLLGFLGSFSMGLPKWIKLASGQTVPRPLAAWEQLAMALICGLFVVLCVQSFIAARKAREQG